MIDFLTEKHPKKTIGTFIFATFHALGNSINRGSFDLYNIYFIYIMDFLLFLFVLIALENALGFEFEDEEEEGEEWDE